MQSGVLRVLLFIMAAVAVACALLIWFLPLQLSVQFRQHAWQASLWVQVKAPLVKVDKAVNITDRASKALEQLLKRWRSRGDAADKAAPQRTLGQVPRRTLLRAIGRPMRYLGRRTRCSHLRVRAEVGGSDAMESALLAGVFWSVVGTSFGLFSSMVRLESDVPQVVILPNFRAPTWHLQADCILRFRLGHAIVAVVWALRRALREKALISWFKQSRRRKGVKGSGGTSDSGPDEDGDGESEGHD